MNSSNRTDAATPGSSDYRSKRRIRILATFGFLSIALIVITVVSAGLGQYNIPTDHVVASLGRRLGMIPKDPTAYLEDSTLWNIRFPRVLLGLLVGAALGCSGAVMQAVFGNPLAEPGVIGVSSGAAVGACVAVVFNLEFCEIYTVPAFAFGGALAAPARVYFLSRSSGRAKVLSMILTGIAVTAVANAAIAFCLYLADNVSRDRIVFWQMRNNQSHKGDNARMSHRRTRQKRRSSNRNTAQTLNVHPGMLRRALAQRQQVKFA